MEFMKIVRGLLERITDDYLTFSIEGKRVSEVETKP